MVGAAQLVKRIDRVRVSFGLDPIGPRRLLRPGLGAATTAPDPATVAGNAVNAAIAQAYQMIGQGTFTAAAKAQLEAQVDAAITATGVSPSQRNAMIGNVNSTLDQMSSGSAGEQKTIQTAQSAAAAAAAAAAPPPGTVTILGYTLTTTELAIGGAGLALAAWLMFKKK